MKRNETYLGTIKFGLPWIFSVGAELRLAGLFPPNLFPFNSNRAALCKYNYSLLKNYKVRVHSFPEVFSANLPAVGGTADWVCGVPSLRWVSLWRRHLGCQFWGVEYKVWCCWLWSGGLLANSRGAVSDPYQLETNKENFKKLLFKKHLNWLAGSFLVVPWIWRCPTSPWNRYVFITALRVIEEIRTR